MRPAVIACLLAAVAGCDRRACDAEAARAAWQCATDCEPGALQWRQIYQGGVTAHGGDPTVDACGGVVVVGTVSPDRTSESHEAFVARYEADGELAWLRTTEAFGDDRATAAVALADGAVLVVGQTVGTFTSFAEVDRDTWVARYEVDGSLAWSRTFDDGELGGAYDVALDRDGRPVIAGRAGVRWLDDGGQERLLVAWDDAYGPSRLAIADDGRLAVADAQAVVVLREDGDELWRHASKSSLPRFRGDGTLLALSESTLTALDGDGRPLWTRALIDESGWATHLTVDAGDRISVAGSERIGDRRRAWVAALAPDGAQQWRWSLDLPVASAAAGLIAGPDGGLVIVADVDHGAHAGDGIDSDVWLGRLQR